MDLFFAHNALTLGKIISHYQIWDNDLVPAEIQSTYHLPANLAVLMPF